MSPAGPGPDPEAVAGPPAWDRSDDAGPFDADSNLDDLARVLLTDSSPVTSGSRDTAPPSSPKTVRLARRQHLTKPAPATQRHRLAVGHLFRKHSDPGQGRPALRPMRRDN
jgi:hypothetical protein